LTHGRDPARGNQHPRAVNQPLLDRVTEGNVGVARALILDIANRRKAGVQSSAGIGCTFERAKRLRLRG